ncbi:MAG: hypothetical protein HQL87_07835 [Magnetococcales bacterium]|nr:hypothetical protein [Magnetococcales bacterium]
MTFSFESLAKRFAEPSTWSAFAALGAMALGRNPAAAADTATQVFTGVSALLGVLMPETQTHTAPLTQAGAVQPPSQGA